VGKVIDPGWQRPLFSNTLEVDLKIKSEGTALLWALPARRSLLTSVALAQEVSAGRLARRSLGIGGSLQL